MKGAITFLGIALILGIGALLWVVYGGGDVSPRSNDVVSTSTPDGVVTTTPTSTPTSSVTSTPSSTPINTPKPTSTATSSTSTPPITTPAPAEISWGDRSKKQVIFTFDGGGVSNESGAKILEVLAKHNAKASFFFTGNWANKFPSYIKQVDGAGHEVFNHTLTHPELTKKTDSEIRTELRRAEEILKGLTGETTKPYFRAPYGDRNARVLNIAWQEGYRHVYWTIDAWDWREGWTDEMVKKRILDNVAPGTIYLMHIGDSITGNILDEVLTEIEKRGYSIVPLTRGL